MVFDGILIEQIDEMVKMLEFDIYLCFLIEGLIELFEVKVIVEGVVCLCNGNSGMVIVNDVDYGEECWVSFDGEFVVVGVFKVGDLYFLWVFVLFE